MTQDRIKIAFRHMQLRYDINNDGVEENVIVVYDDVQQLAAYQIGNVPQPDWVDMTEYTQGLDGISFTWDKVNQSSSGSTTNEGGSNYDKGISATLTFDSKAFSFIHDWLLNSPEQVCNAVEVRITDAMCKKDFRLFEIKADNLKYSPDDECRLEVTLREQDAKWHAVHKTFIWDDWQGWFNSNGNSTKAHPTFHTCIEPRPRIVTSARMGLHFFLKAIKIFVPLAALVIDEDKDKAREIFQIDKFCPAPLIRDIITNFCDKFGYGFETMFTDPALPYYQLCLYYPSAGVFHEDNTGGNSQNTYLFDNRWNVTVAELLDKLRIPFAAEWYITPNDTLIFKPLIELLQLQVIHDFTAPGALSMDGLSYTFNGEKKAAYGRYEYSPDGADLASQEVRPLYNDIVDYDGPAMNPMLEGQRSKLVDFAATGFYRDGRSPGYIIRLIDDGFAVGVILTALLQIIIAALVLGVLTAGAAAALVLAAAAFVAVLVIVRDDYKDTFVGANLGMVRLTAEQTMVPRLLLWDGADVNIAKVVRTQDPTPNTYYNPAATAYPDVNKIAIDNEERYIYNYPLYFEPMFRDNLFDRYHDAVDNPLKSLESNQTAEFVTDLCCETMDLFGCWEGSFVRIGYLIKLEDKPKYETFVRIENITVRYEDFTITIKGKVIKKKK